MKELKILIVDDEESIRFTLSEFLKKEGYQVQTAASLQHVEELLEKEYFHAAFVDRVFPDGIDGIQIVKLIKEKLPECMVVMMTAYPTFESAKDGITYKMFDYLIKPVRKQDILKMVQRMEEELHKSSVSEQFNTMHTLVNSLPIPAMLYDTRSGQLVINQPLEAILKYNADEIISSFEQIFNKSPTNFFDELFSAEDNMSNIEIQIKNKMSEPVYLSFFPCHQLKPFSKELHLVLILDITKLKMIQVDISSTEKLKTIGMLTVGLTHNFNNIMQVVLGNIQLLQTIQLSQNKAQQKLSKILEMIEKASSIVWQLQEFAKNVDIGRYRADLRTVIKESTDFLRNMITKHIELNCKLPDEKCLCVFNKSEIEQILMNLVMNSQDAILEKMKKQEASPTGPIGRIDIGLETVTITDQSRPPGVALGPGRYHKLTVRDDGIGIEKGDIPKIFERFFTKKAIRKASGIGLAWVKETVDDYKGAICVESQPMTFTEFSIYLPAIEEN